MKNVILKISEIFAKHKQLIHYLFFGICTTVIFAFSTNKVFLFESRRTSLSEQIGEAASFFGCRLMTGVLDVVIMSVTVDILKWNGLLWKLISNIIVTIVNYVASKFLIFRNTNRNN